MQIRKVLDTTTAHILGCVKKFCSTTTWVQILDETDCISHSTNNLGKGMNPIILPTAMGK